MNLKEILQSDKEELAELQRRDTYESRQRFLINRIKDTEYKISLGMVNENWDSLLEKMYYANKRVNLKENILYHKPTTEYLKAISDGISLVNYPQTKQDQEHKWD